MLSDVGKNKTKPRSRFFHHRALRHATLGQIIVTPSLVLLFFVLVLLPVDGTLLRKQKFHC